MLAALQGNLNHLRTRWRSDATVCVVLASGGYPGSYKKGVPIRGLEALASSGNVFAFNAGVGRENEQYVTAGGRVLGITAMGKTIKSAREQVYRAITKVEFEGMQYRKDIGLERVDK
jgi:phosphoribosylamine--glycine ligase